MCGRFSISSPWQELKERFGIDGGEMPFKARYNAAPGQKLPVVILKDNQRMLRSFVWGLVPFWAKDKSIGNKLINSRAETVAVKPAFRTALRDHRCLVLADGFFEWKKDQKPHRPYYITLKNKSPFAFAGIYDTWKNGPEEINSFSIITTEPNDFIASIHNRMPVILEKKAEGLWLDPQAPLESVIGLLKPLPSKEIDAHPVSTLVNNPRNDNPDIRKKF